MSIVIAMKDHTMKNKILMHTRRIISLLLLSVLILTLIPSCSKSAGSDTVYSKEVLAENVARGTTSSHNFVWQHLDEWDFPKFNSSKLKSVEVTFRENFYKDIPESSKVSATVANEFLDGYYDLIDLTDEKAVTDALISAYVSTVGDRYSVYRTKEEYREYSSDMSGKYTGIGIVVTQSDDGLILVNSVNEGGSAYESGIKAGDKIVSVDGVPVLERGYNESVDAVAGKEGTTVNLQIYRDGEDIFFTLTRRKLVENSVAYSIKDGIGYIKISSFKSNTDEQFIEAVDYLEKNGVRAVVYDLRNNTGGYLSSVLNALDYVAPKGTTLASFSNDYDDPEVSKSSHSFLIPSVVICNEMTASAGELFTAGIRDLADMGHFDATLVGTKTFGKGIMQSTFTLTDGSTITMTVAYYMPPSGKNYHDAGIIPDVIVERSQEGDAQLDAAYAEIQALLNK